MSRRAIQDEEKRVGIWLRVSTEDQAKGDSPIHHEKRARLYAESKGWKVAEVYHLEGVSGKSVADHPEAVRMLADMRTGRITGLIFSKLARLARNTKELLEFADEFREHGADLISLQESIDTSTPVGRMFYTMIGALAQWEREEIADRVRASVPIRAKLGKPLSGQLPFGYHRVNGKVIPHPEHAATRKLMYELFLENRRKKAVARILNERGYRAPKGGKWTYTAVNRLLRDPTAKGIYRQNFTKGGKGGKVERKPEDEWVVHQIEPIVSAEVWDQVNAILDEQTNSRNKPGRGAVHLFSGLTYCNCSKKMYVPAREPFHYRCWDCGTRIPAEDLEAIYHGELKGLLFSDEQIADQRDRLDASLADKERHIAALERERDKLTKDMDAVFELYRSGELTPAGFGARNRPLENRLQEIENLIPEEQAAADLLRINRLNSSEMLTQAKDLHSRWTTLAKQEKRVIVETITRAITIAKDEVRIDLHYLPKALPKEASPSSTGGLGGPDSQAETQNRGQAHSSNNPTKSKTNDQSRVPINKATQEFGLVRG